MNKTALKNFAVWARKKLISDITDSAGFLAVTENGIGEPLPQSTKDLQLFDIGTKDYVEVKGIRISQRNSLVSAIRAKTAELNGNHKAAFEYIVEEVAYTWFNRMIAIRFMEVNDYLPIRVLSSESGKHEPDIVTSPFDAELDFTNEESDLIYKLRDSNKLEDLFRMLFIKQCNKLHEVLPELFEATNDYTELLLSLSFTDKDGVVYHLVNDISEDDFDISEQGQVEIIGWMYQYYNTEPKDKVFEGLKKNVKVTKENIPAATQLFTPDWIVRYMIENSLGRLWTEGHPDSSLREEWKYYLEEAQQEPEVQAQLDEIRKEYKNLSPEDIKVIDPCMGSGHILVYAFDVLMQIYAEQGYTERDAAKLIVEKNLWGLDIDKRAYQLAYFAVMMKARQYNRRILTSGVKPNLFVIDDSRALTPDIIAYIADGDKKIAADLESIKSDFDNAREYGSIINVSPVDFDGLLVRLGEIAEINDEELNLIERDYKRIVKESIIPMVGQAQALAQKYDVVCTNPPYMGGRNMNNRLLEKIVAEYPQGKPDLYSAFILKAMRMTVNAGFSAMITQHSWMFLSSFEMLRQTYLHTDIVNMCHLGTRAFEEIGGEVVQTTTWVSRNHQIKNYNGTFVRLVPYDSQDEKEKRFLTNSAKKYFVSNSHFDSIPGKALAYWLGNPDVFTQGALLEEVANPRQGMKTLDNDYYIRFWYEVSQNNIMISATDAQAAIKSGCKWFPINHGGEYRKYYGNNYTVVNWYNDGEEMKANAIKKYHCITRTITNIAYYFKQGVTWSVICSKPSFRWYGRGFLFSNGGQCVVPDKDGELEYITGILNSKVTEYLLNILSPTLGFESGYLKKLPIISSEDKKAEIINLTKQNISICKTDWDSFETSWDFKHHPLIRCNTVKLAFSEWSAECDERFNTLKSNEEELNRIFIDIYGLQDELTPEVEDKDVTVRPADLQREIKSLISYAVGCMFGRYSIYKDGMIFAGEDYSLEEWTKKINDKPITISNEEVNRAYQNEGIIVNDVFFPDDDNCIPITDEEYFKDDIVVRFVEFIRTVYGSDTLEQNLNYIADALGTKGNTSRERIRNYFLNDFIKDHIKTYQKRPIYWLFDSGKQNGFKALVYMHRWNADTTGNVRVEYLHKLQRMYENEIRQAQDIVDDGGSAREVSAAQKRIEKLTKQLKETRDYDEKIAHLAVSRIDIDLDDGVKVNYEKVQTGVDGKKVNILFPI